MKISLSPQQPLFPALWKGGFVPHGFPWFTFYGVTDILFALSSEN
jgi:hypothetical protein